MEYCRYLVGLFLSVCLWGSSISACGFEGFYLGEAIGATLNRAADSSKAHADFSIVDTLANFSYDGSGDVCHTKPSMELFTGYGRVVCQRVYLGVRAGINLSSFDLTRKEQLESIRPEGENASFILTQDLQYQTRLREIEYTLDGKIGGRLCQNTLLFVLVGVAFNTPEFRLSSHAQFLSETETETGFQSVLQRSTTTKGSCAHLRWGVGVERQLPYQMTAQLLYTYTNYGSLSAAIDDSFLINTTDILSMSAESHTELKRHALSVALSHYF